MRTLSAAQTVLVGKRRRKILLKVEVQDGDGDFQDLSSFAGKDWIQSVEYGEDADGDGASASIQIRRDVYDLVMSPTVSGLPNVSTSGDPLLQLGRLIKISTKTVPEDSDTSAVSYSEVFAGVISDLDWAGKSISLTCRDLSGRMQDRWIEDSTEYGGAASLEANIQSILDQWGPGNTGSINRLVTFQNDAGAGYSTIDRSSGSFIDDGFLAGTDLRITNSISNNLTARIRQVEALTITVEGTPLVTDSTPRTVTLEGGVVLFSDSGTTTTPFAAGDSPGWNLLPWDQPKESVMSILGKLADQIGWALRYKWNSSLGHFALTLYEPDRASTTADHTITEGAYLKITKCSLKIARIRNVVEVRYFQRTADAGGGNSTSPAVVTSTDSASVSKYGRRWMQIAEDAASQIDSATEAQAMADACRKDLSEPEADLVIDHPYFWATELQDLYSFPANGKHFSSAQKLAVVGVRHRLEKGAGVTSWTLRGKPATRLKRWHERATWPGVGEPVDDKGPAVVTAGAVADNGAVVVSTSFPHNPDFLEFEFHASTTSGFTPSASTIFFRGRQRMATFTRLHPEDTYYFRIVPVDIHGNRGAASPETSASPLPFQPAALDPKIRWPGGGLLGGSFDRMTAPRSFLSSPPDGWEMAVGTWATDAGAHATTLTGSAAIELKSTAVATKIRSTSYTPVIADEFYRIVVPAYASSVASGNKLTIKVAWYDPYRVWISNTTIYDAELSAINTWENVGGIFQVPSTATYARITIEKAANLYSMILDRVDWAEGHPSFHATKSTTTSLSATAATWARVNFDDESATGNYDRGGLYDNATNYRFDAPTDGLYSFSATVAADACDGWLHLALFKNGSIWKAAGADFAGANKALDPGSDVALLSVSADSAWLSSGDYIEVKARGQDNLGAVTLAADAAFSGSRKDLF